MRFESTPIAGTYVVGLETISDDRGFFARAFCEEEFVQVGLDPRSVQSNLSFSKHAGTIRGLHWQLPPFGQGKVMRCIRGALWDMVVDVRVGSVTLGQSFGIELSADNRKMLVAPADVAHGFLTLQDDTEALYHVTNYYMPELERGIRYDDPGIKLELPIPVDVISDKDRGWPDFDFSTS